VKGFSDNYLWRKESIAANGYVEEILRGKGKLV